MNFYVMQNVVLFNLPVTLVGRLEGRNFFCSAANKTEKSKLWKWPQGMHAETMCFCFRKKKKPLKLSNGCSGACFAFRLNLIKEKYHCIAWRFNFKASQEVCLFLFFFFLLTQSRHSVPRTGKCSTLAAEFSWLWPTDTDST